MNDIQISRDKKVKKEYGWQYMVEGNAGVNIPVPHVELDDDHQCKGCVWYSRDTNVLFCPFHSCIRDKSGLGNAKRKGDKNAD